MTLSHRMMIVITVTTGLVMLRMMTGDDSSGSSDSDDREDSGNGEDSSGNSDSGGNRYDDWRDYLENNED